MDQQQQLQPSQTDPRPPTGETPTQPPLSSSSTVGTSPQQKPKISGTPMTFLDQYPIPLFDKKFQVTTTTGLNVQLFTYTIDDLFNSIGLINTVPFQWRQLIFSRRFTMRASIVFVPVKVSDAPVTFDVFTNYNGEAVAGVAPNNYDKDYVEINISDSKPFEVPIPMFWLTGSVLTYYKMDEKPRFRPKTRITIRLKNSYSPTQVHPIKFTVYPFLVVDYKATELFAPDAHSMLSFWLKDLITGKK